MLNIPAFYTSALYFVLTAVLLSACSSSGPAMRDTDDTAGEFSLLNKNGDPASYTQLLEAAAAHDIVLFGELHGNATAHRLQHKLSADLDEKLREQNVQLFLAMEMFEADQQSLMDGFISGRLTEAEFEDHARLWQNYESDYKPLIEFASTEGLPVIASNIPRPFASQVHHEGLESLDALGETAQNYMAPLPIEVDLELPGYAAMLEMGGHGGGEPENLARAQAVKDATMAHFMLTHLNADENRRIMHFNGRYHSDNYEGIYWYLRHYGFEGDILTISTLMEGEAVEERADFILMTE